MEQCTKQAMDRLGIDPGIRGLVGELWDHGYETMYSCEGHDPTIDYGERNNPETGRPEKVREVDTHTRYVTYRSGTGDGWFEKNAPDMGFVKNVEMTLRDTNNGSRVMSKIYTATNPYETELPNGDSEINWNAILKFEDQAA